MPKAWTRCQHDSTKEVVFVRTLGRFCDHHGLDRKTCYGIRSGKADQNRHHGWKFEVFKGQLPMNAVIFDEQAYKEGRSPYGNDRDDEADGDRVPFAEAFSPPAGEAGDIFNAVVGDEGDGEESPEEKYRRLAKMMMNLAIRKAEGDERVSAGVLKELANVLDSFQKAYAIDPETAKDTRPINEQVRDGFRELLVTDQSAFERTDKQIDGMIEEALRAVEMAEQYYDEIAAGGFKAGEILSMDMLREIDPEQDPEEPPGPKVIAELAMRWVRRFRKIKRLAQWAREAYEPGMDKRQRFAWGSTHLLRFMLYVGRPDIPDTDVLHYMFADFHVEAAAKLWIAKHRWKISAREGLLEPGEGSCPIGGEKYYGVMILLPPRHGKTDLIVFDTTLDFNLDPREQQAVIHAKQETASERMLVPIRKMFEPGTAQGRRNARLYPGRKLAKYDNNMNRMRLATDNPPANPNLLTGSPFTAGLGNNLNKVRGDDLVPSTDRYEASRREQRKVVFHQTWGTRTHGKHGLFIYTGYPHHHEDMIADLYNRAIKYQASGSSGGGINMLIVRRPVGGPKTTPRFFPIWPEMYDARWLEQRYHSINNPTTWASNYQLTPMPDDLQIVRATRLFDPTDPAVIEFLQNARYHLSLDPAANGEEVNDKAGLVVVAVGDMEYERQIDRDRSEIITERVALVVHEAEFHATQSELTAHVVAMGSRYDIEYAHIEQVTALGTAMAESLEENYGITQVVLHPVRNKNKAARLRAVAPVLEHSNPNVPAPVAFAGVRVVDERGRMSPGLAPAPEMARLVKYVEHFHAETGKHSLDALTQVLNWLVRQGELKAGTGEFSRQVANGFGNGRRVTSRKLQMFTEAAERMREHENRGDYALLARNQYNMV